MSNRMNALAQHLTGKETINDCSIEEVQHLVQRHPYFAPAQFLLLQKLREAGKAEEAEAQYRKAVLFFHDPLLFEHFISSNKFYVDEIASTRATKITPPLETEGPLQEILVTENTGLQTEEQVDEVLEVSELPATQSDEVVIANPNEASIHLQDLASAPESADTEKALLAETERTPELKNEGGDASAEFPAPVIDPVKGEASTNALTFEPFHTVDYFASQGIKISQEELPKDKLGKQLKSFTEWLKTMKRLPASQMTETMESSAEKKVESMASHSVSESDVVTEAMAEVWLKQGATEKALDIYNKLSLQNPSKKAYFAAKIENLKPS